LHLDTVCQIFIAQNGLSCSDVQLSNVKNNTEYSLFTLGVWHCYKCMLIDMDLSINLLRLIPLV